MHSSNPYLDTSLYEIEFNDGHVKSYAANLIAENIYEQLDDVGNKYHLIDEIIDHQKDNSAMSHKDSEYTFRGCTNQKRMTRGWFLCVQWKDGSMSWEHLHDLKESNPVEVAKYCISNHLLQKNLHLFGGFPLH